MLKHRLRRRFAKSGPARLPQTPSYLWKAALRLMYWGIVLLIPALGLASIRTSEEAGWVSIFDGRTLEGWSGDERFWRVEGGAIVGRTTPQTPVEANTFLVWQGWEIDDFELRFRYRIDSEWANSGVQVRSKQIADYVVHGYQADIATEGWISGILYEEGERGILARRGERVVLGADGSRNVERFAEEELLGREIRAPGEWNDYRVVGKGATLTAWINGVKMHEVIDGSPMARERGILAFQIHRGPPMTIRFQEIRLRRLLSEPGGSALNQVVP